MRVGYHDGDITRKVTILIGKDSQPLRELVVLWKSLASDGIRTCDSPFGVAPSHNYTPGAFNRSTTRRLK